MKIGIKKTVEVEVKTLKVCGKCCDCCSASLHDQDGEQIGKDWDNYVPMGMGLGDDPDYIDIEIDLETGKIVGWQPPTQGAIEDFINNADEGNR